MAGLKQYLMAKRLQRLGMPMDSFALSRLPHGAIAQRRAGYVETCVFDTESGDTGFLADLRIICDSAIVIDRLEVELPWCTVDDWLSETRDSRSHDPVYALPNRGLTFPAKLVINDRVLGRMSRGSSREGILVGIGLGPIPSAVRSRSVKADLVIYDIWGNSFVNALQVAVFAAPLRRKLQKPASLRVPLFSPGDRPAGSEDKLSEPSTDLRTGDSLKSRQRG